MASELERVLIVSKPLRHPFRDGTTVLAGTLARGLSPERRLAYFGDPEQPLRSGADDRVIPAASMSYAPGLQEKVRMLGTLLDPRHADAALHAFFTPSRLTSSVLVMLKRLRPQRPVILTVTSSAGVEAHASRLRELDALVVSSDHTRQRLIDHGVPPARIHRIYPGVDVAGDVEVPASKRLLYAGDLDHGVVERLVLVAQMLQRPELRDWTLVIASRPKGPEHAASHRQLTQALQAELATGRVELLGEVDSIDSLLRSARVQLFLADHVERKVDIPLVVLEGLARGVGLCSLDFRPVSEIFARAAAHGLEPGLAVPPADPEALAQRLGEAMADNAVLLRWGADARELVQREFSATRMVSEYDALYDAIGEQLGDQLGDDKQSNVLRRVRDRLRPGA